MMRLLDLCVVFICITVKFQKMNTAPLNTTPVKDNWLDQKPKLMKKYPELTEKDLSFEEGKKEEMIGKLQVKLGKNKEELQKIIESL